MKYEWPETDGLVAYVREHGVSEAARRLGVAPSTLRGHLNQQGISAEIYSPPKSLPSDALKEIADLLQD